MAISLLASGVCGYEELSFDYNGDFTPVEEYYSEARFLNFSLDGVFNNSLLTVAGIFIAGIILFELALYALDVYYNQTYTNRLYNRNDEIPDYGNGVPPLLYQSYPAYYDAYQETLRRRSYGHKDLGTWSNLAKIPQWLNLAYQIYESGTELLGDMDCQKKAVCEVYQNAVELGEVSKRAKHSLDYLDSVQYFSMPDEVMNIVDEFLDAKQAGISTEDKCDDMYMCQKSLLKLRNMYNNI